MFIYFLQTKLNRITPAVTAKQLGELGLSHIADSPTDIIVRDIINGPGASIQAIASRHSLRSDSQLGYFPDRQDVCEFDRFAIAKIKDESSPALLERKEPIDSHTWTDWRGQSWKIPIAKRWKEEKGLPRYRCALDRSLKVDRSGEWILGDVLPKHKALWELATDFFDRLLNIQKVAETEQSSSFIVPAVDLDDLCSTVFGANYRVSKYEIGMLEILRQRDQFDIMNLVIDLPGLNQLQKKTA